MKSLLKYNILSFFILTYLLSWISWICGYLLFSDNLLYQLPFLRIGAFAPALISILLCSLKSAKSASNTNMRLLSFFIVWIIASIHFYFYLTDIEDIEKGIELILVTITTSMLPAFVLSSIFSKRISIKEHLSTILFPKGKLIWYLIAFLFIPIVLFLDLLINIYLGNEIETATYNLSNLNIFNLLWFFLLIIITQSLQAGGLSEEPGWRGYAQKNLQKKYSPLLTGILIGLAWGIWHFPVYISQLSNTSIWMIIYGCLQIGLIFTWIYNCTKGSLLAVIILHASWNTFTEFLPKTDYFDIIMAIIIAIIIIHNKMWKKSTPFEKLNC